MLEYLPGGVLMQVSMGHPDKDVKSPFSLDQTREYFRQLCLGLEYLHANEVIHRDVSGSVGNGNVAESGKGQAG